MTHQINAAGIAIIRQSEGYERRAYQDTGGVWTIGIGHTPALPGQALTDVQVMGLFRADIAWAEDAVEGATHTVATNDNEFSAMVSLTFNIGAKGFRGSSILRLHLAGDTAGAADAFKLWDKDNGRVLQPLVRRRAEERALYLSAAIPPPILEIGVGDAIAVLDAIKALQTVLQGAGLYKDGKIDGAFGPLSYAAVRAFETRRH